MSDLINRHLEWCREQREQALKGLNCVKEGMTFHEGIGTAPMRDVTAERVAHWKDVVERMEKLIAATEARLAQRT